MSPESLNRPIALASSFAVSFYIYIIVYILNGYKRNSPVLALRKNCCSKAYAKDNINSLPTD